MKDGEDRLLDAIVIELPVAVYSPREQRLGTALIVYAEVTKVGLPTDV